MNEQQSIETVRQYIDDLMIILRELDPKEENGFMEYIASDIESNLTLLDSVIIKDEPDPETSFELRQYIESTTVELWEIISNNNEDGA